MSKPKRNLAEKNLSAFEESPSQAVKNDENFADPADQTDKELNVEKIEQTNPAAEESVTEAATEQTTEKTAAEKAPVIVKKSGTGLSLLALLVALGVGGAGYFFGNQKVAELEAKIAALANLPAPSVPAAPAAEAAKIELPTFEAEKAQISKLEADYQQAQQKIAELERSQQGYTSQISQLQLQLQKLDSNQSDPTVWLLADADGLLNNALRKMVLDDDIGATKRLLAEADAVLSRQVSPKTTAVREAIKADLNQLSQINSVDQNALMQRLTTLANRLDDLPMLENQDSSNLNIATGEVSNSIDDWQKNIEKSASSFLDHFIRVSDRSKENKVEFVAPNQEIYLRENIRLRLQIAILAIPRQQNELYKQSLEAVSAWIRSYFDVNNDNVKNFLKELDDLADQSIYLDVPESLQSVNVIGQLLNKAPEKVQEIKINAETALPVPTPEAAPAEAPKADAPVQ